jgi:hypothetical protein
MTADQSVLNSIQSGDAVRIDNSWPLALQTYHRHQVPPGPEEYAWNQFRDAAGRPIYPQREMLIGHVFAVSAIGSLLSGQVHGKMLLVQSLMDIDAVPWCADWYRSEVKRATGPAFDDRFALWFIDHAQHDNPQTPIARAHAAPLGGALQQGLRDLARWVEQGIKPSETSYRVVDTQVEVPPTAAERGGPQPVVHLQANGAACAQVAVGEPVTFTAVIETPPGAGPVVAAEWDFDGLGTYPVRERLDGPQAPARLSAVHAYAKPGTYYPVLRAGSQREGDMATPYARVENIGRARVDVKDTKGR